MRASACVGLLFGLVGCGIDVVGASTGGGANDDGGPAAPSLVPNDGGNGGEAGPVVPPGVGPSPNISWKVTPDPPDVDLTAEGTLDWAHWGEHPDGTPVRKATGGARIGQFVLTSSVCNDNSGPGWPVSAKWSDGTPEKTSAFTDLHRRIYGSNATGISISVACDGASHVLSVDLGGWSSTARFEAAFDNIVLAPAIEDTKGNAAGYHAQRYAVTYVCPVGTNLVVRWVATNLPTTAVCAGSDLILSSATLR